MDRKYAFYEIINKNEKINKNNKIQCVYKIDKIHNVYDDDYPEIIDLNNGRILSWLIDDKNIKIIEYGHKPRIIKSINRYSLHNAGLISDKYIILMGLNDSNYYTWLMDSENYEIIRKWTTSRNDCFLCTLYENHFLYGDDTRLAYDEFYIKEGKYKRKNIYESDYNEKEDNWKKRYGNIEFLSENTFITYNRNGELLLFYCEND